MELLRQIKWKGEGGILLCSTKNSSSSSVGIDIGLSSISLVELKKSSSEYVLKNFTVTPLPGKVFVDREVKNNELVVEILKNVRKESDVGHNAVNIAISGSFVMTKLIQCQASLSDSALETKAWLEATKNFSQIGEQMSMDFCVLGPTQNNEKMLDVMLVAARSDHVESRLLLLEKAGFVVNIVDVDYFALANVCEFIFSSEDDKNKTIALFIIDEGALTLVVMRSFIVIYTREIALERGNVESDNFKELDEGTKEHGEVLGFVVSQIQHALHFFYSASEYCEIDHLLLAGVGAYFPSLVEEVEKRVEIQTAVANPFTKITVDTAVDKNKLLQNAPLLVTSFGLALRGGGD